MRKLLNILPFIFVSFFVHAKTIKVGKLHEYTSIQQAITGAQAGDTVLVETGVYKEKNIVISKPIYFIGLNFPVLDGESKYEVVSIKCNGVVIDGFKVIHSGVSSIEDFAGIKIYNCRDVVVKNNILDDTFFGIYAQQATNCTIEKNTLKAYAEQEQQSGNGIHCWKSDSMKIIANTVSGHRDGIYFEFVTNSIIWRNTSFNNMRYGLHFMFSNNDSYITNIFKNNGAGVAVMFSNHVKMIHNYFEENWGDAAYGLLLKEISDSYISNNRFTKNTTGIHMEGTSRIVMENNVFENNGWGLKIQASCMEINLINSNFIGNTFDVGTNGSLVLNTFNNNYWDKYDGYDLNKDKIGDVPYRPVSMYSMIIEQTPPAMILFRSFMATLLDKTEKIIPTLTPENLKDDNPLMKPLSL
ncbi:MAG: nitrous oxide reductase family maturation protein NosD [Chitinophagaceae bacterium]|nr:nitrous oxide reductase family maturation protein NosD [Chitinophagaceae bacterium]